MGERTPLILASTSRYRRDLLARLGLQFECVAPDVDETPEPGESPQQLCARLSIAKAEAVALRYPQALVIGSDQVADLDGKALGKPGNHERAQAQLAAASGKSVRFHTGVCVQHAASGRSVLHIDLTEVRFRTLSAGMIEHYLDREPAWDCAGGFKCEGLGISLFEAIHCDDPTALVGLPLIAVARLLAEFGADPLA
jgi:septum formation protein